MSKTFSYRIVTRNGGYKIALNLFPTGHIYILTGEANVNQRLRCRKCGDEKALTSDMTSLGACPPPIMSQT